MIDAGLSRSNCLRGLRVLIAEDEHFIADEFDRVLRDAGATVVGPTARCADALRIVQSEPIDLAIVDLNLSGEMAYDLLDALIERDILFSISTGYHSCAIELRYRHLPRWNKPFDSVVVADRLCALMGTRPGSGQGKKVQHRS